MEIIIFQVLAVKLWGCTFQREKIIFPNLCFERLCSSLEGNSSFPRHIEAVIREKSNTDVFDTADPIALINIYLQTLLLQIF